VISSLHVATGAFAGAVTGSRVGAAALAPVLHVVLDVVPHEDIDSRRFELATAIGAVAALAIRHGALSPQTIGGALSAAPDLEHVLPLPRPRGRKLFPSHWFPGRQTGPLVPAAAQLVAAGALLAVVLRAR